MKNWIIFSFVIVYGSLQAQVGINTTSPNAQLEIKSSDQANPANNDGILIPKVDAFPAINPTIDQDGMMVYLTTDVGANLKGFYYWDYSNAVWKSISGDKGWGLNGNAGTDIATHFIGTTDNVGLKFKVNNAISGHIDPVLFNTTFGIQSHYNNTTGYGNSAFGHQSSYSNTTGYYNSSFGFQSFLFNTNGYYNSAFGSQSLLYNNSGHDNSAFGTGSLRENYNGNRNSAFGTFALNKNTTGSDNTAVGYFSLLDNTTGINNTAIGSQSLASNTSGNGNTASGKYALYFNTTGYNNVAVGNEALFSNTLGFQNTAIGYQALQDSTIGCFNTASGNYALTHNIDGGYNSAYGTDSMYGNYYGNKNCAFGNKSLYENYTGNQNCAFGGYSMYNNHSGSDNSAFGTDAMRGIVTGNGNSAFGALALRHIYSGEGNIALGLRANSTTTTGWNNIGIGFHSLGSIDDLLLSRIFGNEIGYDNIGLGLFAGDRIGNNCNQSAFIGPFTNVNINNTNVSNSTAIGNGALVFQNNMMRLGNSAVTRIETQVGLTVVSDGRYKYNVKEEVKGLDFIKKLRPVVYQYDTEKMDREWMNVEFDTMVKHNPQILKDYKKANQIRYSGFIAQEVEQVAKSINYEFSGISKPENADGHYGLDYSSFVVPLVKAVQEQQEIIERQNTKIESLEERLKVLEEKLKE